MNDPMAAGLAELVETLDRLHIPYAVGGSLASSAHGAYRFTADADLIAAINPRQAQALAQSLGKNWYVDEEMIVRALQAGRAFNLIHIVSAMKFDIFPATTDFHDTQLQRAASMPIIQGA